MGEQGLRSGGKGCASGSEEEQGGLEVSGATSGTMPMAVTASSAHPLAGCTPMDALNPGWNNLGSLAPFSPSSTSCPVPMARALQAQTPEPPSAVCVSITVPILQRGETEAKGWDVK